MIRRRLPLVPAVVTALAVVAMMDDAPSAALRQQTFRAGTDAVTVDVAVRVGDKAVTGLAATDFVLLDNGVKQRIDAVDSAPVPLDLTVVLDLSGDQRGTWIDPVAPSATAATVNDRVQQITGILRPDDRLRLLAIDTYGRQLIALQPASSVQPLREITAGGLSSLYDTVVAALLQPVEPNRRHVVLVATKGKDTVSATGVQAVRMIAARSDVLLHIVMLEGDADDEDERFAAQCMVGICSPTRRFWVPFVRRTMGGLPAHTLTPEGQLLAEASELTGGAVHQAAMLGEPTAAGVFRATFGEFRQSYQLRYTPQGVKREGWHTLAVTVPGSPKAAIRARRGYAIAPAPEAPMSPRPGASIGSYAGRLPTTYDELTDVFGRAGYGPAMTAMRGWQNPSDLIRRLEDSGNPWPGTPKREAAFALELAEAGLFSRRQAAHEDAQKLLLRFHRLIRHPLEPDLFEQFWLWTELTILQGTIRPAVAQPFVRHALERFPDEPRFLLARAIVTDQLFPFMGSVRTSAQTTNGTATPEHVANVAQAYGAAMKSPETAAEARVRLAWFLHRVGRDEEALAQLDEVHDKASTDKASTDKASTDKAMRYFHQLFRGHIQGALGRTDAAIAAYRLALERWPGAQSAEVALMNALLQGGHRDEAEAAAERIQTAPADVTDPWFSYWQGDYRFYPAAMTTVREMIR